MTYQEYTKKSVELAKQTQEKMTKAVQDFDSLNEFNSLKLPEIDANLRNRIAWMLIDCCRHNFIEIVTMLEEQERLVSENEPDAEKKIKVREYNAWYREEFQKLYEQTRKFMDENFNIVK